MRHISGIEDLLAGSKTVLNSFSSLAVGGLKMSRIGGSEEDPFEEAVAADDADAVVVVEEEEELGARLLERRRLGGGEVLRPGVALACLTRMR